MTVEFEWVEGGSCVICDKPFEGLHLASKQTCGNTCRQKLHRLRESRKNPKNEAYRIIARVLDRALQEIDFSIESEEIQAELRAFRDKYW